MTTKIKVGAGITSLLNMIPGVGTVTSALDLVSNFIPGQTQTRQVKSNPAIAARRQALAKKKADLEARKRLLSQKNTSMIQQKGRGLSVYDTPEKQGFVPKYNSTINDKLEPWNPPPTTAQELDAEKEKNKTILYVGLGVAALGVVYMLSNKKGK